jgi:phosphonate transport system substrate-binding protein
MIHQFAPILTHLEASLASNAQGIVRLDLAIYGTYEHGIQALINKKVDFMRLGPASYVIARRLSPEVELVAVQDYKSAFRGAIFTREDTGITNLVGLIRRGAFAFGDPESTSGNFLSKKALLDEGVTGSSLIGCCTNLKSHSVVLTAVVDGQFIAGAGNASAIEQRDRELRESGKPGLRILKRFKEPATPWVARRGMDPEVVARLRACLRNITDTNILNAFKDEVIGFMEGSPNDYDSLERDMSAAKIFESR